MAYTTVDQLVITYPALGKTSVSSATIMSYISKGADLIDGYIYTIVSAVPVSPAPPMLKDLNDDLSYVMFLRRNTIESGKDNRIKTLWDECINTLEGLRDGKITLVGSGGVAASTGASMVPTTDVENYIPTFGIGFDITDAEVDPDRDT